MTTIAYRDGVMAADSGCWIGDAHHPWTRKLARGPNGTLYGVSGDASPATAFLEWVDGGCEGEQPKPTHLGDDRCDFIVLVADARGRISLITARGCERYPDAPYMAIGAGATTALGALWAGATAAQAIDAAIAHGEGASAPVRTIGNLK